MSCPFCLLIRFGSADYELVDSSPCRWSVGWLGHYVNLIRLIRSCLLGLKTLLGAFRASLLGTRASLLGAPGLTTRSKEATNGVLLSSPGRLGSAQLRWPKLRRWLRRRLKRRGFGTSRQAGGPADRWRTKLYLLFLLASCY